MTHLNEDHIYRMRSLSDKQNELLTRQAEILQLEADAKLDAIKEFVSYEYKFTHPTINWKALLGPIMTLKNDFLYVYSSEGKVSKFNLANENYETPSSFLEIVKEGGFEDALAGFAIIDQLYDEYLQQLNISIQDLEYQLKSFD